MSKIAGCRVRFKSKDGRYTVTVLDLPDCIVNGATLQEAKQNAKQAIALYFETHREAAAVKFLYDLDMCRWGAQQIGEENEKKQNQEPKPKLTRADDLRLEGFLLHARILRDFFVGDPQGDDILAQYYFDNPSTWKDAAEPLCPHLKANRVHINKKLAHLTYSRLTEDEDWDVATIAQEVKTAWETFRSTLPQEREKWFPLDAYSSARDEPKDNG